MAAAGGVHRHRGGGAVWQPRGPPVGAAGAPGRLLQRAAALCGAGARRLGRPRRQPHAHRRAAGVIRLGFRVSRLLASHLGLLCREPHAHRRAAVAICLGLACSLAALCFACGANHNEGDFLIWCSCSHIGACNLPLPLPATVNDAAWQGQLLCRECLAASPAGRVHGNCKRGAEKGGGGQREGEEPVGAAAARLH